MSRFNLPEINFFEKDIEAIESDMLFIIEEKTGLTFENADPRKKWVQSLAMIVFLERNKSDYSYKQNFLAYAEDEYLDHRGIDTNTERLEAKPAFTIIEFILEENRVSTLVIEANTLFLVGTDTFFKTLKTIIVPVGQDRIQVEVFCTEPGDKGNGYLPGEISNLVNPLPWVKEVKNILISSGGVEVEEDDAFAERIRISPESFSVAGPEEGYKYWTKSASQEIEDVSVYTDSDAVVNIRVLLKDGELPSQQLLDQIEKMFKEKPIKPLTDKLIIEAPDIIKYDAEVEYWILEKNIPVLNAIQDSIKVAFEDYIQWQKLKMGRDVDLTELITRLKNAGASRVAIKSELFIPVGKDQVANENEVLLEFVGVTDG